MRVSEIKTPQFGRVCEDFESGFSDELMWVNACESKYPKIN